MNIAVNLTETISGYRLVENLYDGSRTTVYRAIRQADPTEPEDQQPLSVVIKLLKRQYPSFSELVQFQNQYAITRHLNIPNIIKSYSLEPYRNSYALLMEDFGGISLRQFTKGRSLPFEQFQPIALQLVQILHQLHHQRVIHKDIKPANILIHPETQQIRLIDFSIASLLPRETQEIQNPNTLEGTLAYLSPEQTGRMNRGIDYRSDFYSLGVTFFELLTGQLPFQAGEPRELVHCHIAKQPLSICDLNSELPLMLGEIVRKLMAKNAEDRYQNAIGLQHDLIQCQKIGQSANKHSWFELGQRDLSDRFLIPEKLYGREQAVATLLDAFGRVANGAIELMLVAGFSGIGKTAVVNEVHKPIVRWNGYFIKGKFDQFNRNIPLSAFVQALRDLMGQLLSETDQQVAQWRDRILSALGENAQIIIDVIPELEQIVGKQPPVPDLTGSAAQNRFNLLFQKFVAVFATSAHPLVVFLDDLQWADSASLNLIQMLMSQSEAGYLLLIGAYRDNEVSPTHPLMLTLEAIKKNSATLNTLPLNALHQNHINHLIADTFSCSTELALPLTELVYQKAKGNPFFTTQFLKALYEDGLITFDWKSGFWQCDVAQVRLLSLTDDVVEFMALQLQKLPAETQNVLKLAACIGAQFDLGTLAIVSEKSQADVAANLWKALQEGLVLPQSEVYKFYQESGVRSQNPGELAIASDSRILNSGSCVYKFLHDRVQQAAYSLIEQGQKQSIHLLIGTLLLENLLATEREDRWVHPSYAMSRNT
ncbi:serine/threonine-protein kinase PknK [Kovacikia minuta CCNUW1]|uniref:ATP-binding protein n=1 Tax=Kovacikia minuta TaxID=2931930 RepID=UPI001CCCC6A0|nr:serine/threonine-protein kinase PknK [Kovacikia minuta CCNUW1]